MIRNVFVTHNKLMFTNVICMFKVDVAVVTLVSCVLLLYCIHKAQCVLSYLECLRILLNFEKVGDITFPQ